VVTTRFRRNSNGVANYSERAATELASQIRRMQRKGPDAPPAFRQRAIAQVKPRLLGSN
jgi:hypothetical protein